MKHPHPLSARPLLLPHGYPGWGSFSWSGANKEKQCLLQRMALSRLAHLCLFGGILVIGLLPGHSVAQLIDADGDAGNPVLRIEAETAELSGAFVGGSDALASGGGYIHRPHGMGGASSARFNFTVADTGRYAIEGGVFATNGADDSFIVQVQDQSGVWFIPWNRSYNLDLYQEVVLEPGTHQITVFARESGARLDYLQLRPLSIDLHVDGRDTGGDGSAKAPFQTIQAAIQRTAALSSTISGSDATVHIKIAGGTYRPPEGIVIRADDFPQGNPKMVLQPATSEDVLISGNLPVDSSLFKLPTDPAVVKRIRPEVLGSVFELDLSAVGLREFMPWPNAFGGRGGLFDFLVNGQSQPISRYPNGTNTMTMGTIHDNGGNYDGQGGRFEYKDDRHAVWSDTIDKGNPVWLRGYWRVVWQLSTIKVQEIDQQAGTVTFSSGVWGGIGSKWHRPQGSGMEPYWIENLLEEIDEPREWAVDFEKEMLYCYLEGNPADLEIEIADYGKPIIQLDHVHNVTVERLTVHGGRDLSIEVLGGESNLIGGCTVKNALHNGIYLKGGFRNKVQSCDIHDIGHAGVIVAGGTPSPFVPCEHEVINNHIYRYAQVTRLYGGGVDAGQTGDCYGARIANNVLHDTPHGGLFLGGMHNVFEYNDISRFAQVSNDIGGFYSFEGKDTDHYGHNVFRYNHIHDSEHGHAIYVDLFQRHDIYKGNFINNVDIGFLFKSSEPCRMEDNIVLDSGIGWAIWPMSADTVLSRNVAIQSGAGFTTNNFASPAQISQAYVLPDDPGVIPAPFKTFKVRPDSNSRVHFPELDNVFNEDGHHGQMVGLYADEYRTVIEPRLDVDLSRKSALCGTLNQSQHYLLKKSHDLKTWDSLGLIDHDSPPVLQVDEEPGSQNRIFYRIETQLK